ncbi:hypothetical protein BXZ70DRAFT_672991 [Cristinia sonorae]|uniref:Integral membrane protein n=1 Tax=Cristinia sonorae TaxID=1940300 RepID=A0A8K0UTP1_9AGAR|nr:hypothetical protein BXZ70DRAFT_672991 [Cristinia sonorae]
MSARESPPPWPSLYNFFQVDVIPIGHRDPIQPNGYYLHHARDMYRFTLYWTLVFYVPSFVLCGTYAFLNIAFLTPSRRRSRRHRTHTPRKRPSFPSASSYTALPTSNDIPLLPSQPRGNSNNNQVAQHQPRQKLNERRSRLTFALLVLLVFFLAGVAGAVLGSAIVGYVLAGLYKSARFNMSTWMPFFGGLIQTSVGLLGLWPSLIDII